MTENQQEIQPPDIDDLFSDYVPPDPFSKPKPLLTSEEKRERLLQSMPQRLKSLRRTLRIRHRTKLKQQREHQRYMDELRDYSEEKMTFRPPAAPENRKRPYDYGKSPASDHEEPKDMTPAAEEFRGIVDLFDPRLFPAQNSKNYNDKSGREFLADFTKATRGQLVLSMARLAQTNPVKFAQLWIEMEKFNTPQQSAVDVSADLNMKAGIYAKLDELSGPLDASSRQPATNLQEGDTDDEHFSLADTTDYEEISDSDNYPDEPEEPDSSNEFSNQETYDDTVNDTPNDVQTDSDDENV